MPITMVKSKMPSIFHFLAKKEVAAYHRLLLIDPCGFQRKGGSRDADYNGEVQNAITSSFTRQTGSDNIFPPLID